jgi:hypothetical protein
LILFHTTNAAKAILVGGFRDGSGSIVVEGEGVFLSEKPLIDAHEGATGDQLLVLDFGADVDIDMYEVPEVGAPRQWFMPAAVINDAVANELATVRQLTDAERDAALDAWRTELAALMKEETTE